MSPEQAQGQDVKASSDIFTVGLMLYELLAGTTPFQADSAIASLLMRTQQRAAPLVNIDRNIPGTLSNIVVKCLEKDPAKRYQSARASGRGLEGVAERQRSQEGWSYGDTAARRPCERVAMAEDWDGVRCGDRNCSWSNLVRHRQTRRCKGPGAWAGFGADWRLSKSHGANRCLDDTLEPMLGVAMEGASFINVYSRGDARKVAKKLSADSNGLDEQSSRLVAVKQSINAVIIGDISMRGDQYEISAVALDGLSGNVLAKSSLSISNKDKQDILKELPKLAIPIRQALGDKMPASQQFEKVSGGFAATSLDVVHLDAMGVDEQFAGKFQEAFDSFKAAADKDPKFARAYTGMAAMAQNLGRPGDAVKYMKLAMANADRMTERERYRNQGLYSMTTGDWENCVAQYITSWSPSIPLTAWDRTTWHPATRSFATHRRRSRPRNTQSKLSRWEPASALPSRSSSRLPATLLPAKPKRGRQSSSARMRRRLTWFLRKRSWAKASYRTQPIPTITSKPLVQRECRRPLTALRTLPPTRANMRMQRKS